MKKLKFYTAIGLLSANFILTSCTSEEEKNAEIQRKETILSIISSSFELTNEITDQIYEEIEREREEKAAFEKTVSNYELVETEEFKSVNRVVITWNNVRQEFLAECYQGEAYYTANIPEVRLMSYMLKKCNCEYLHFHNLENTDILDELSTLPNVKELSIYDSKIDNLDVLSNYKTLEGVRIENCSNIRNIDFISSLENIAAIELAGTKVSDLTPLSNCENLTIAKLRCNAITNPEVIATLPKLTTISLEYNNIKDVKQLEEFIKRGIFSNETAEDIVETTTNHKLIFTMSEENTGVKLVVKYYDAQKEYDAEVFDKEGTRIGFLFTDEVYNLYDISKLIGEQKYLSINNLPEDAYIHHIKNVDDYVTVEVTNCLFDYFSMPDNTENLTIFNCPNLGDSITVSHYSSYNDLKYLSIRNTKIKEIAGIELSRDLEVFDARDNNIADYSFLSSLPSLKKVSVTEDNPLPDISVFEDLIDNGVDVVVSTGINNQLTENAESLSTNSVSSNNLNRAR